MSLVAGPLSLCGATHLLFVEFCTTRHAEPIAHEAARQTLVEGLKERVDINWMQFSFGFVCGELTFEASVIQRLIRKLWGKVRSVLPHMKFQSRWFKPFTRSY